MNKQELIKEYESIVKDDSLDLCGCYNMGDKIFMRKIYKSVLEDLEQLDEPQKIKLKDVIARIEKFDLATKTVWINEILNELGSEYGAFKYKAGYEQGKFDGAMEHEKVTIPQFVADYIDFKKTYDFHVYGAMRVIEDHYDKRVQEWFYEGNIETFARAWLDGYEIEKEKRYLVKMKGMQKDCVALKKNKDDGYWYLSDTYPYNSTVNFHTRKELEEAGFGWVFNCEGVEIKEVEK